MGEMPMGLTKLSEIYQIREGVAETILNTFAQEEIQTGIDAITQEVLLVWEIDMELTEPDTDVFGVGGPSSTKTSSSGQITEQSETSILSISDTSLIGRRDNDIVTINGAVAGVPVAAYPFQQQFPADSYNMSIKNHPLAILTGREFYIAVKGNNNATNFMGMRTRMFVQRAKASAVVYAALIAQRQGS